MFLVFDNIIMQLETYLRFNIKDFVDTDNLKFEIKLSKR